MTHTFIKKLYYGDIPEEKGVGNFIWMANDNRILIPRKNNKRTENI